MKSRSRFFALFACTILAIAAYALIAGCAVTPATPQQAIFQIKSDYADALSAAVLYDSLPPCTAAAPGIVCSDASVRAKLKQAKDIASPAIQAAENAVRDPNFDKSTSDAVVAAARQAVLALTQIIATLPVPKAAAKPTTMYMSALPAPHEAAVPLIVVLSLLTQLLQYVPAGTALWQKISDQKTKFQAMVDAGRDPTDEEWAALDAEVKSLEAQVDAGAAQA